MNRVLDDSLIDKAIMVFCNTDFLISTHIANHLFLLRVGVFPMKSPLSIANLIRVIHFFTYIIHQLLLLACRTKLFYNYKAYCHSKLFIIFRHCGYLPPYRS